MNKVELIAEIADGRFHSGTELGKKFGISRAAIWKVMQELESYGIELHAISGKGYRLNSAISLLDAEKIIQMLPRQMRSSIPDIQVFFELDSTNAYLMSLSGEQRSSGQVCMAEFQHSGRGRRGRQWISPAGANIYMSIVWRFAEGTARLSGLSLAIAVALNRALQKLGLSGVMIKWPNDLLHNNKKLAGILLELSGDPMGACDVVCGIGINVTMPATASQDIDQPWTDLHTLGLHDIDRNKLVSVIISELLPTFQRFETEGFSAFKEEWLRYDASLGKTVKLALYNREINGIARGVDDGGMLLIDSGNGVQRFASGEVSLRFEA